METALKDSTFVLTGDAFADTVYLPVPIWLVDGDYLDVWMEIIQHCLASPMEVQKLRSHQGHANYFQGGEVRTMRSMATLALQRVRRTVMEPVVVVHHILQ